MIIPRRLPAPHSGQGTIGIIAPASPQRDPGRLDRSIAYLESLGYQVKMGMNVHKTFRGYLAGTDRERLHDIHDMFADESVDAIFCTRGGYGTPRLLDMLDYDLISRNPKIFVGFSDISALQLAVLRHTRLVTYSGAMPSVDMADGFEALSETMFWDLLCGVRHDESEAVNGVRHHSHTNPTDNIAASGTIIASNLSLLCSMFGTQHLPDLSGSILVLEDIGEETYKIDRMLNHLRMATETMRPAALVFGYWSQQVVRESAAPSASVDDVLADVREWFKGPILINYPYGHEARKNTLPVGVTGNITTDDRLVW